MLQYSAYHSVLRIASLTLALLLVFQSGLLSPVTQEISSDTIQYVASAIGVNATVSPNELNVLTAELTEKRQELNEREAALSEREIAVGLTESTESNSDEVTTYILSLILFILLILIVLNYILDYLRQTRPNQNSVAT